MKPTLYSLPDEVEMALDAYYACFDPDTGEQVCTDEEYETANARLANLMNRVDENMEWILKDITNRNAQIAGIKEEIDRLSKRMKSISKNTDRAEMLVERAFDRVYEGKPMAFGNFTLSYRKSEAVKITDPDRIPTEYLRTPEPPAPEPDKTKIKNAIKSGIDVSGAEIEGRKSLQIR